MYLNFMFLDQFFLSHRAKKHTHTEKPIVAFTNGTVFILGFYMYNIYIYMTKPVWSYVSALSTWNLKQI